MNSIRLCPLLFAVLLAGTSGLVKSAQVANRPNVLIVIADDCTYNDLPVYGGRNAHTPHIDALASQGVVFNHAYVAMSICQPCRSELYSGQFPVRNGCAWNHAASKSTTRSLPQYLGELGYRVGIAGKVDVFPRKAFPFEDVAGFDGNCVDMPTKPHSLTGVHEFITRKPGQPFCLVVGLVEPHVPWVMGDPTQYPPGALKLPDNIADTPTTRRDFGHYLAEITYMDGQVGDILGALTADGADRDTLVLFTSEQGSQFPGNKWTCWDTGVHTGLIARWPGKAPAGTRTDAIVEYADVTPTLVELAGGHPADPKYAFDGTSFAGVMLGREATHRPMAYGILNNFPEGSPYPSRTVTDGQWRYIRNLTPNELYLQRYIMGLHDDPARDRINNRYWGTWVGSAPGNAPTYNLVKRYILRPAEELYHTGADPYEMTNLAGDPQYAAIRARLSGELDRWMAEQGDAGAAMDTPEAFRKASQNRRQPPSREHREPPAKVTAIP